MMYLKHKIFKRIEAILKKRNQKQKFLSNPKSKSYIKSYTISDEKIRVEFYLMDAFEIFHFKPIYEALKKDNRFEPIFVCEPQKINACGKWFDYETAKTTLKNLNLSYKENANPDVELAVSTQNIHTLYKYNKIRLNIQYGTGFNKSNFCNSKLSVEGYDYRFVYSDYTKNNLKKYINKNRMFNIGLPKQDKYFDNLPAKKEYNTDKPVLMYFPTWDEDSSVSMFYEELKKLKDKFFIITKAHHCTFRLKDKEEDLKKLYKISDIVLEGNSDFAQACIQSNIAIIDAKSGASTEVPYINPDMKILYLSPRKFLHNYFYKDIFKFGYIINNPEKLKKYVDKIYNFDKYTEIRKNKISYYMNNFDGKATQRAIHAINEIINIKYTK